MEGAALAAASVSMGGGGGFSSAMAPILNLGAKIFSSVAGLAIGIVFVVFVGGYLLYFVPMQIQGNEQGVKTGNAIKSDMNVAAGAWMESSKTSKADRQYGRDLQDKASASRLASEKKG